MIELAQVAIDDPRLARLLQLYMHEWSAAIAIPIDQDGLYTYDEVELYRDRAQRAAHLFFEGGERPAPVGFALTMYDDGGRGHVEELFVIAGARRRGLGAIAARHLFATRPGRWTLTVRPENPRALAFWRTVVPDATETIEPGDDGVVRTRLAFLVAADPRWGS